MEPFCLLPDSTLKTTGGWEGRPSHFAEEETEAPGATTWPGWESQRGSRDLGVTPEPVLFPARRAGSIFPNWLDQELTSRASHPPRAPRQPGVSSCLQARDLRAARLAGGEAAWAGHPLQGDVGQASASLGLRALVCKVELSALSILQRRFEVETPDADKCTALQGVFSANHPLASGSGTVTEMLGLCLNQCLNRW